VARVRTVAVALIGTAVVLLALRAARRFAVADRLGPPPSARTRLPAPVERRIARALDDAMVDLPPAHAVQVWAGGMLAAAILGVAVGGGAAGLAAIAIVGVGTPVALVAAHGRRARAVAAAVPPTVDRVASELRAGGTIATAVTAIAHGDGALASDFARVEARVLLGAPLTDALDAWARERSANGVDVAAGALAMCATVGGRAADALEGLASSLRDRAAVAAEAQALSAQARLSAIVVGGAPLLYLGWSALTDENAFHALTGTPAGRVCVVVGLVLEVVGAWWMRRILRAGSVV
jgi:tight adherence protein B